jgi:hypothetical protein
MTQSSKDPEPWENNLLRLFGGINIGLQNQSTGFTRLLDLLALFMVAASTSNDEIPKRVKELILKLGKRGWFLTGDFTATEFVHWKKLLESNDEPALDKHFIEYFRTRVKGIEKEVIQLFPQRKQIIQSAFRAHKRKNYLLSVPVLYIQADGICLDKLGFMLFKKQRKTDSSPTIATIIDELKIPAWERALMEPLIAELPLNANTRSLKSEQLPFNRHAILHGLTSDYGNEENSLKAISLLGYAAKHISKLGDKCKVPATA